MKKLLLFVVAAVTSAVAWGQCLPTYNSQCTSGDFINNVTFNTISNLGTGCPNPSANNYTDYTAISTNLQQNTSYTIDVTPGPSWGQYFVAYIDFNNDLDFDDAGEFFDIGYAASGTTISAPILIPNGIAGGSVTMRVMCQYGTGGTLYAGEACSTGNSYGEVEDYTVNISSPLTDDAGITAFISPSLPTCSFADSVEVELYNFGTDTLFAATINWSVNAAPQAPYSWTGALAPFTADTVNLGLVPLASGDNLVAISSMPNGAAEDPSGAWNDFADIASLQAGLSGVYTVGGATPDYADLTTAVSDLNTFGVCGPITFDIRDGVYNEQIDLIELTGMDATNSVTFRSENGDAALVTISYASTGTADNFVVNMGGGDYFNFEDLTIENTGTTYGRVLQIQGGSDYNTYTNCHFHTLTSTTTSTNVAVIYAPSNSVDNGNVFMDNTVEGGSYGAYYYGGGTTNLESGTVFQGNTFMDNYYYGARFDQQDAPILVGNTMMGESTYTGSRFAMYINYCDNGFIATDNVIQGSATSGWRYGMYILNCDANSANHADVSNNMVQVGQDGSTSTFYGMYMSNCGYVDVYHNSSFVSSGGTSSRAFYGTSGGANSLANNIFVNYTAGHAIYLASNYTVTASDNNLFHSPSGNLGYYGGTNQATLADWQGATSYDGNSIDTDPMFHSTYDLHVCNDSIKGLGMPLAIDMDIDGQPRDAATPDMGADEFSALGTDFLGSDIEVCTGEVVTLSAGSPTDMILWSTGDTTMTIDGSTPGTYDVSIVSVCGTDSDTINVVASALVYTDFLVADELEFCAGDDVMLYSNTAFDTYAWTGGDTNDTTYVTAGGTYTLDVTDACGTGSESVTITENTAPNAAFTWTNSYVTGLFNNTSTSTGTTTYDWDFGDGNSSSEMSPNHVYDNSGTYTVTLTVTNDCGTDTYSEDVIMTSVGLEEIDGLGTISIYPNPSTGLFQLDVNINESLTLDLVVTNMLGEEVAVSQINALNGTHSGVIDLSTNASGVYFLKVISDNNTITTHVLVKK